MTAENFFILSTILGLIILIAGFGGIYHKLKKRLENDEWIIDRLDILINSNEQQNSKKY
ncbi:hypothetical protein SAMN04487895_106349 [Paenibacillus sophorae]|uniref:Uncharacterized protein n=1 Tax=Paenibacillus sophorae TaxID=1333845 RepID=A0A1H8NPQ2_9BACL|nr:hypothetical protein [Paenibacillus sophorae]QWU14515.1 hypothetical protein KP014_21670 [Paenibacillus sophorae]SEO31537.1 hypothetical protein SAMN04487895_106349 [Paenibacillus sophorae]